MIRWQHGFNKIRLTETCPGGWAFSEDTLKCYYVSASGQSWNDSLATCQTTDPEATLVSWHSQLEVDFITGELIPILSNLLHL